MGGRMARISGVAAHPLAVSAPAGSARMKPPETPGKLPDGAPGNAGSRVKALVGTGLT